MNEQIQQNPTPDYRIRTIGEMKKAIKTVQEVYVWVVMYNGQDGEYVEVTKKALLRAVNADIPYSRDGAHDDTEFSGHVYDGPNGMALYVN